LKKPIYLDNIIYPSRHSDIQTFRHSTMVKTCSICVEEVHESRFINCTKCNEEYCFTCFDTYVKTLKNDIKCMSCNVVWEPNFIYRNIPLRIIYSTIKKKREEILLDREKALLPLAQLEIERKKEIQRLSDEIWNVRAHMDALMRNRSDLETKKVNVLAEEKKPKLVCGCPMNECRGFINMPGYKCGVCDTEICGKCHVIKDKVHEHICKDDDVKTVELLKKDTKPCPGCGAASKKTEGCNQVWCMNCHKAWSWSTGKIETGTVHATDYINYLRTNGITVPRAQGDIPGGNGCNYRENNIWRDFPRFSINAKAFTNVLTSKKYITTNIEWVLLQEIFQRTAESERIQLILSETNLDLGVKYITNEIDEKSWKSTIMKRDKENAFRTEIHNMRMAYFETMRDMYNQLCTIKGADVKTLRPMAKEIFKFHDMMNEEFATLKGLFKSSRVSPFRTATVLPA